MGDPLIDAVRARALEDAKRGEDPCALGPPVDAETLARAERILGRRLPSLLRALLRTVGDGGFGPGLGLLPLFSEGRVTGADSIVQLYSAFVAPEANVDGSGSWPEQLVPFCDWGCAIRSCIDCSSDDGAIVTLDAGNWEPGTPRSDVLARTHPSLRAWVSDWLGGVDIWKLMFEPDPRGTVTGLNPVTRKAMAYQRHRLRRTDG